MNDKQNAVAKAIADTFGQGDTAYGGNMVDAVYAGLKLVANSIDGCEYNNGSQNVDGHSLCQSIDKLGICDESHRRCLRGKRGRRYEF